MKLNRKWRPQSLQLSTPGMIDIVFLLLIFFLVNASYRPNEKQVETQTTDPNKASARSEIQPLEIKVTSTGQGASFEVAGRTFRSLDELGDWLGQWPAKDQPVVISNSSSCPVGIVIKTINQSRESGFKSVSHNPVLQQ